MKITILLLILLLKKTRQIFFTTYNYQRKPGGHGTFGFSSVSFVKQK